MLPDGKVLAMGASSSDDSTISSELYDPATEVWSTADAPSFVTDVRNVVLFPNGDILAVAGGSPWDYADLAANLYEPATGNWTAAGYFSLWWAPTATLLRNGKVLVTGLQGANYPTQASLYDPDSGAWGATGSLSTFRHSGGYSATLLADGRVLIAGGVDYNSERPVISEELYDPATGTWSFTGRLTSGRRAHTATLLGSGRVLIAGGVAGNGCDSGVLRSAEIYDPGVFSSVRRRRRIRP
jgi:hypothetical protein